MMNMPRSSSSSKRSTAIVAPSITANALGVNCPSLAPGKPVTTSPRYAPPPHARLKSEVMRDPRIPAFNRSLLTRLLDLPTWRGGLLERATNDINALGVTAAIERWMPFLSGQTDGWELQQ